MSSNDELMALFDRMCQMWTDGDAEGYGACFTADSDYVSYDGTRAIGRKPMVAAHDELFRGVLAGSGLIGEVESIRYLSPEIAVLHATGSVLTPWRNKLPRRRVSRQTLVAVRTADGWRFAALHNCRVRPVQIPARDSFPARCSQTLSRISRAMRPSLRRAPKVRCGQSSPDPADAK
jgi:uncharacterized protein (TIGR02246 family)